MRNLALTIVVTLMLAGCVPSAPSASPTPEPSTTPVFASEEEALAAAEEAYAVYVALADQIFKEGGADPERLSEVATGTFLEATVEGFRQSQIEGLQSTGGTVFRNATLQMYSPESAPLEVVSIYVCEDISAVDVVDASGRSVVSPDRPDTTVFQAIFDLSADGNLLLSSREVWKNEPC